jgi:glycosyltransferase involved in cell wall biosynthesis
MVSLRIAIAGTRGVPPRYGGFETFAAELSTRLVERGHEVTVYCRRSATNEDAPADGRRSDPPVRHQGFSISPVGLESPTYVNLDNDVDPGPCWNGVRRIVLPAIRHKYLETVSHTFFSAVDLLRRDFDAVLLCNAANAFVLPLLRAARLPVAINVDGIERNRRKWNVLGKAVYAVGESFSALFASRVVADAHVIADYYRETYGIDPIMIPYGAEFPVEDDSDVLRRLGIEAGNYILYVSRFEPENNPLEVVAAYEKLANPAPKLVMLGSAAYARSLEAELHRHASARILFPGGLYGADYRTLQRHALIYVQATEVGGTHPAMIEAMASGGCVLANDTPENREVGGDTVGYFSLRPSETLSGTLQESIESPERREAMRAAARDRVRERYGWTAVTDAYETLFSAIAG